MASAMMSEAASTFFTNTILLFSCLADQATRESGSAAGRVGFKRQRFFIVLTLKSHPIEGRFAFNDIDFSFDDSISG
jgi:hypothetical protein